MKAICIGTRYEIYSDTLKTYDQLPAQVYSVCFDEMTGFYLNKHTDIEIKEKVYGVHTEKVEKVIRSFEAFERSLGVILSGSKGIGKSMFAKMLACRAVQNGMPVLIVDCYRPGIASYLESIDQEIMILFDEFDKTFGTPGKAENGPQTSMLSLFDGVAQGKKLFVITCNQMNSLNEFLVNRPGRFHYHFRFNYPSDAEIRAYLHDKLQPCYTAEIEKVVAFSMRVNLNYDCLRAIAFELNRGESFEQAIADLNILNLGEERYDIVLQFANKQKYVAKDVPLNLFDPSRSARFWMPNEHGFHDLEVSFNLDSCVYNYAERTISIDGKGINLYWNNPETHKGDAWAPKYAEVALTKERSFRFIAA